MKTKFSTLITCLIISVVSIAQIIHVPGDLPTIQVGIDAADDGYTVLVDQGIYYENINFMGKAITVMSNYLNSLDSADIFNTIIDGGQPAYPDEASVVYFISGEDTTSVLCGFTIQHGSGTYPDSWGMRSGGGILCEFSGATIIHNRIINNTVIDYSSPVCGGGVSASTNDGDKKVILLHNTIANNQAITTNYPPTGAYGSGVMLWLMDHTIQNNVIKENYIEGWAYGAGIFINGNSGITSNNLITNNTNNVTVNAGLGGGIHLGDPGPGLRISQNAIIGNICTGNGSYKGGGIGVLNWSENGDYYIDGNTIAYNSASWGGGINLSLSEPGCFLTNNIIRDNHADLYGGGICGYNSSGKDQQQHLIRGNVNSKKITGSAKSGLTPQVINNTIINNTAGASGGAILNGYSDNDLVAFNNIIYGNDSISGDEVYTDETTSTTYLYNNDINPDLIFGNHDCLDNIFADPEFIDGSCHIDGSSPCFNEGESYFYIGNTLYECPDHDMEADPRPFYGGVDIGADEWNNPDTKIIKNKVENYQLLSFPNPFTICTTIQVELKSGGNIDLSLYDLSGKKIETIANKKLSAGKHEFELRDSGLKKGIYVCILKTNSGIQTRKIIKL